MRGRPFFVRGENYHRFGVLIESVLERSENINTVTVARTITGIELSQSEVENMASIASKQPITLFVSPEEVKIASSLLCQLQTREDGSREDNDSDYDDVYKLASWAYAARRERSRIFPADLFSDPAWDMLLVLYCLKDNESELSVTSLIYSAELAQTTGLRWIRLLEEAGLIQTRPDPNDRRRILVRISDDGKARVEHCLVRSAKRVRPF
jgi:DNA-binding MarR family transcriptional regulator